MQFFFKKFAHHLWFFTTPIVQLLILMTHLLDNKLEYEGVFFRDETNEFINVGNGQELIMNSLENVIVAQYAL